MDLIRCEVDGADELKAVEFSLAKEHKVFNEVDFHLSEIVIFFDCFVKLLLVEVSHKDLQTMNFLDLMMFQNANEFRQLKIGCCRQRSVLGQEGGVRLVASLMDRWWRLCCLDGRSYNPRRR